jgi:hypothetical protein
MILPVGAIIQLFERLLSRSSSFQDGQPHHDVFALQQAMVRAAAARLGVELMEVRSRLMMRAGPTLVEVKFQVADRAIQKMAWVVSIPPPGFPVFKITKRGPFSFARQNKAPRGSVPELDNYYDVQTSDPESVRELWPAASCHWLARMSSRPEVTSDGRTLQVSCPCAGNPDILDIGVKLCFALARSDVFATKLLRELPDAVFVSDELPFVRIPGPGDIRVGFFRKDDVVVTRAHAAMAELTDTLAEGATKLGAKAAIEKGELVLAWPTVIRDKQRLLEVVDFLRNATSGSRGVFR